MKTPLILILLILIVSCNANKGDYEYSEKMSVIFKEDINDKDIPFEPTISEVQEAEIAFRDYLTQSKSDTINFPIKQNRIPNLDRLEYYKRRYFGRVNIEGEKVIKVEYIFNRCISGEDRDNKEWKNPNYLKNIDSTCWFKFQYNLNKNVIYGL